jgi:hypothetical protein
MEVAKKKCVRAEKQALKAIQSLTSSDSTSHIGRRAFMRHFKKEQRLKMALAPKHIFTEINGSWPSKFQPLPYNKTGRRHLLTVI